MSLGSGLQLLVIVLGMLKGAKDLIHEDKVVSVVGLVVGVVDGVVFGTKDGPDLAVDVVMDVSGPHPGGKEKDLVREEVHGAVEERPSIRDGL